MHHEKLFPKVAAAEKTFSNGCVVLINDNFTLSDVKRPQANWRSVKKNRKRDE